MYFNYFFQPLYNTGGESGFSVKIYLTIQCIEDRPVKSLWNLARGYSSVIRIMFVQRILMFYIVYAVYAVYKQNKPLLKQVRKVLRTRKVAPSGEKSKTVDLSGMMSRMCMLSVVTFRCVLTLVLQVGGG